MIYFNVASADDMLQSSYNTRQDSYAKTVIRGSILDKDGNVLAYTNVADDGTETRIYPYSDLYAQVVGYTAYSKGGLESRMNYDLLTSNSFMLDKLKNDLQDRKQVGDNVVTTLNTKLQQAASDALGSQKGAVVVMEPSTGKILAMVSKPSYDPNTIVTNWEALNTSEDSVLLNRATKGLYVPGSTFKLVTTLEFMRENPDYNNYTYNCTGTIEHQGTSISCAAGGVHGVVNLADSLAYSCNTSFSNIGLQLDVKSFLSTSEDLLFNKSLPGGFGASKSVVGLEESSSDADKMMTAMGQGKVQVSPYHMALITSAIANGGSLMEPYIVDHTVNDSGTTIDKNMPKIYKQLMTADEASTLRSYMTGVVDHGTATSLGRNGYDVAGKTGTAEYSSDKEKNHSWFVGFSNLDNPDIVVSVIIESADGNASATSIAGQVFDAFYY
ncbi:MAG: peptidoglycan D,D-transpeptidase FtsI family protein [Suipraeoptans sp.]